MHNPFEKYSKEDREAIKEAILHSFAELKTSEGVVYDHYSKWYQVYMNELMPYVTQCGDMIWKANGLERGVSSYRNMILKLLTK